MSFYSITTPDMKRSGTASVSVTGMAEAPYNFLGPEISGLFQTNVPFSLLFTQYEAGAESPFQLTMMAPDFMMYTSLSETEFNQAVRSRPLHQHNTYELMYVMSGSLYQRIENARHLYEENSCCLINRAVRHAEEYDTDFHSVNLSLSRELLTAVFDEGENNYFRAEKIHKETELMKFLSSELTKEGSAEKRYIDFHPLHETDKIRKEFSGIFREIMAMTQTPAPGTSLMIRAMIYRLLTLLNNKDYFDTRPIQIGTPNESRLFSRISDVMEETGGRISRNELSDRLNYSGNYLNRIVHKFTGMNIFEYGLSFSMHKAGTLLRDTDHSISDIISILGFTDRTHFYTLFKKEYGMTPKEYRKAQREIRDDQ